LSSSHTRSLSKNPLRYAKAWMLCLRPRTAFESQRWSLTRPSSLSYSLLEQPQTFHAAEGLVTTTMSPHGLFPATEGTQQTTEDPERHYARNRQFILRENAGTNRANRFAPRKFLGTPISEERLIGPCLSPAEQIPKRPWTRPRKSRPEQKSIADMQSIFEPRVGS
jgi:hypothetical protein